jgi:hypothetical protein
MERPDFAHGPIIIIITDFGELSGSIPFIELPFRNFNGKNNILRQGIMQYLALRLCFEFKL